MTHEQEIDYSILSTINGKAFFFRSQLEELEIIYGINALQISNGLNATYLISREETANYGYGETSTTTSPDNTKISLSKQGKIYLDYLTNEKGKEAIDITLKQISIDSISLNKKIPKYALGIAIITVLVPFGIYLITRGDILKVDIQTKEKPPQQEAQNNNHIQLKPNPDSLLNLLVKP